MNATSLFVMKIRTIAILFLLMLSGTTQSQTYSSIVPDNEIYDFLNWLTKHGDRCTENRLFRRVRISQNMDNWTPNNFFQKDTVFSNSNYDNDFLFEKGSVADSLFSQTDRESMYQQFVAQKDPVWKRRFKGAVFAKKGKSNRAKIFYSIPLFSLDRNYALVKMCCYSGELNAFGGYFIYRKMGNHRWKFVEGIDAWQS